jgi:hypothetical protein
MVSQPLFQFLGVLIRARRVPVPLLQGVILEDEEILARALATIPFEDVGPLSLPLEEVAKLIGNEALECVRRNLRPQLELMHPVKFWHVQLLDRLLVLVWLRV